MRMNRKAALVAGAGMAAAFLAACSDTKMGPESIATVKRASLAVAGTVTGITSTPVVSEFRVCKEGNVAGTFTVTRSNAGSGSTSNSVVGANYVIQPGTCAVVAEDDSPSNFGSNVQVTETSAGLQSITGQRISTTDGITTITNPQNGHTDFINSIHGIRLTFTNRVEPPQPRCTFTKGFYRNKGTATVIAVDGRSAAEARLIFDANPGKPGGVTFGEDNTRLNLYQQFLAALNNLGGDANEDNGPAAVDAAIDAVQAGTGGTGLNITSSLTQEQMSALIDVLSAFNEGEFAGFPHCDD